jgi:tellurite resistance protein TerB
MTETAALTEPLQTFLRALASETRQRILFLFMAQPSLTVGQVAAAVEISPSTASEHLAVLRRAGILTARRTGKEVYYQPQRTAMLARANELLAYLTICCPPEDGAE